MANEDFSVRTITLISIGMSTAVRAVACERRHHGVHISCPVEEYFALVQV